MKIEDVKVGMKVVPFQKTTDYNTDIKKAFNKNDKYMVVTRIDSDNEVRLNDTYYFYASDFEPYEEEKQMNYIEQVAKMLGVEVGEWFNVVMKYNGEKVLDCPYKFIETDFVNSKCASTQGVLYVLIAGTATVEKITPYAKPTKVRPDSKYYYINYDGNISIQYNQGETFDYAMYSLGNMFDTDKIPQTQIDDMVKKLKGDEAY